MFASIISFGLLALPLAASAESHVARKAGHHREVANRARSEVNLFKRFSDSKWSFYDVGLGACGGWNVESDFIVALNSPQYGGGYPGPNCGKTITMTYNGKTTQATIVDECPGCPYGGLDLSRSLFRFFAPEDKGLIYGSWNFNDGAPAPAPAPAPTTSKYVPPPTTSKWTEPTTESKWVPPPTPTSTWVEPTTTWTPPAPETTSTKKTSSSVEPTVASVKEVSSIISSSIVVPSSSAPAPSSSSAPAQSSLVASGEVPIPSSTVAEGTISNLNTMNLALAGVARLVAAGQQL